MENPKIILKSLIHALAVLVYVSAVAWIMKNGERIFGQMDTLAGPIAFLLLFVLSATIVGLLILGRPVMMYLNGQKSEAVKFLVYEIVWLALFLAMVFVILTFAL